MVYYLNESKSSISDLCNEFAITIDEALHEYSMSILSGKYNFIYENGYEMPINEAKEKKESLLKKLIQRIKKELKRLCDSIISKLNSFINNHSNSKIKPFIEKIRNIFNKTSNKLDNSKSADEAKSISNDASEEMKNTAEEAEKKVKIRYGALKVKGINIEIIDPINKEEFEKIINIIPKIENNWNRIIDESVSDIKYKYKENNLSEDYIKNNIVLSGVVYKNTTKNICIYFRYNPTNYTSVIKIKI